MIEEPSLIASAAAENPWLDLRHYVEGDAGRFFGRDREVASLARLVRQETLTVFYGVSGLGKTSLLLAGLFPVLRQAHWLPMRWMVGRAERHDSLTALLLEALFHEALEHGIEAPKPVPGDTLWSYFHRRGAQFWDRAVRPVTPVLVLDQFEEIFTTHGWSPDRTGSAISQFLEELGQLVENQPPEMAREVVGGYDSRPVPLHVVLSLREDYLAPLQALRRFLPALRRNEMRLVRLRKEDALQVVLGREREWAGFFSGDAPAQVLDAVGEVRRSALEAAGNPDDGVDPAILSVFLHRLFERARQAGEKITPELVAQHRGNVLDSLYTDALAQVSAVCDAAELGRTQQFLEEQLIAGHQPPFRVRLPVAVADHGKVPRRALTALREARLITADGPLETGGGETARTLVELTHDCLCDVLLRGLEVRRADHRAAEEKRLRQQEEMARLRTEQTEARAEIQRIVRRTQIVGAIGLILIPWVWIDWVDDYRTWKAAHELRAARYRNSNGGLALTYLQGTITTEVGKDEVLKNYSLLERANREVEQSVQQKAKNAQTIIAARPLISFESVYPPAVCGIALLGLLFHLRDARRRIFLLLSRCIILGRQLGESLESLSGAAPRAAWWLAPLPARDSAFLSASDLRSVFGWKERSARFSAVVALVSAGSLAALLAMVYFSRSGDVFQRDDIAKLGGRSARSKSELEQRRGMNGLPALAVFVAVCGAYQIYAWWRERRAPEVDDRGRASRGIPRREALAGLVVACLAAGLTWQRQPPRSPRFIVRRRRSALEPELELGEFRSNPKSGVIFGILPKQPPKKGASVAVRVIHCRPLDPKSLPPFQAADLPLNPAPSGPSRDRTRQPEARVQLAHAACAFEQVALAHVKKNEIERACALLLGGVRHDLRYFNRRPSFHIYDLLAGLSVRHRRPQDLTALIALIEKSSQTSRFASRQKVWTDPASKWFKKWADTSRPLLWSRLPV